MEESTKVITATELKANLGKYLDYVADDSEVVVTKNGRKAVRLTPYIKEIERVKESWIADPEKRTVMAYSFKNFNIDEYITLKPSDTLQSFVFEGLTIAVDYIFQS